MRHFLSGWPSVSSFLLQGPELHSCVVTLKSGLENCWKLSSRGTGEKTRNLLSMGSPASIPSGLSGLLRFLRKEPFKLAPEGGSEPWGCRGEGWGLWCFLPKISSSFSTSRSPWSSNLWTPRSSLSQRLRNEPFLLQQPFHSLSLVPVLSGGGVPPFQGPRGTWGPPGWLLALPPTSEHYLPLS